MLECKHMWRKQGKSRSKSQLLLFVLRSAGENEANVRYLLDKWSHMRLVEQPLVLGGPGLAGPGWLTAAEAQLVQRFDPAAGGQGADDTIGFFIAKFIKHKSDL